MAEAQDTLDVSDLKENFLECSVCLEHFDQAERRPRLLVNCLHAFCTQCLEQLLKKEGRGQVTCPNCRQVQQIKGNAKSLPVDPVRNKLVDYVQFKKNKKIPCTDCPDGGHAVVRCHECKIYMCTPCKEAHRRNRPTRKHICQSLEDALSEPIKSFLSHFCKDHPDHKIEFYCGQCSSLCCVSCSIVKHKGHDLDPLEDAANSMLSSLKTKMKDVEKSTFVLRRRKASLERDSSQQEQNLKQTTLSINQTFEKLFGQLKSRQNKLITELQQRTESTMSGLKKQREATEDSLAQMESTLDYFKHMESKSDDCEVLSAGPVLVQSLEAAAAVDQTQYVQNPTWTFSLGENNLISKVQTFGGIHSTNGSNPNSPVGRERAAESNSEAKGAVGGGIIGHLERVKSPREGTVKPSDFTDETQNFEFDLPGSIVVKVHYGNIVKIGTDGIVNAANSELQHYAGVAGAIERACGRSLTRECDQYIQLNGPLNVSEVMHTTSGDLNALGTSYILHTVGLVCVESQEAKCGNLLTCTFMRCMDYARTKLRIRSIAFPFISAGVYGAPLDLVVESFVDAMVMYAKSHQDDKMLREIHLVNTDREMMQTAVVIFKHQLEQGFEVLVSKAMSRLERKSNSPGKRSGSFDAPRSNSTFKETSSPLKTRPDSPTPNLVSAQTTGTPSGTDMHERGPRPFARKRGDEVRCPICMDPITDCYKLEKCGHTFCTKCIRQAFKQRPACPVCGMLYGSVTGNQPRGGRMSNQTLADVQVPGYKEARGAISIVYYFPGGLQEDNHPNTGKRYAGIKRTAYLPNNTEGREVLRLLEKAFKAGLTFTIGTSRTTGHQGVITWNDIHHKTSLTGGPENCGYPDPDYLRRVKDELAAKGITD